MTRLTNLIGEIDYDKFKREWRNNDSAILCHTSGSTGRPSLIELPKEQMVNSALRTARYFNLDSNSHLHSCISPEYIGGKMMFVRAEVLGCGFSNETPTNRPLENYSGQAIDLLSIVPSQLLYLLDREDAGEQLTFIKNILVGGAPLPEILKQRVYKSRLNVFESYGMTETSSHIAIRHVAPDSAYFQTLEGITVSVKDDSRLTIRIDGWKTIATNDVAELKDFKRFKILGRADNVIISGGKKIHPENLESKLESVLEFEFYITSRPDDKWGQAVIIAAVDNPRVPLVFSDSEILEICRHVCLPYETPKAVERISELPLTPNGKLRRNKTLRN